MTSGEMGEQRPETAPHPEQTAYGRWALLGLLVLALVGIGITDFSSRDGFWYWLSIAPVFAVVSAAVTWSRARSAGGNPPQMLGRQVLHWVAMVPALGVVYALEHSGRLNREDAGLVSLMVLSLTTLIAGVHFDWRLACLGALLALASVCAALIEEFFWMILLPLLLLGIAYVWWMRSAGRAETPARDDEAGAPIR